MPYMESSEEDMAQRKLSAEKDPCLDLRVFYMRLSSCPLENTPLLLTLRYIPRDFTVGLEVNGERIAPSETASSLLRRDRVDKQSEEVTYVSTDNIRITGAMTFEVYEKDVLLVCGKLQRLNSTFEWRMDCCAGLAGSLFLGGGKTERRSWSGSAPAMEVYVAGCCSGVPVIWTKKIQLVCGRKSGSGLCVDNIPEDEKSMKLCENKEQSDRLYQHSCGIGAVIGNYAANSPRINQGGIPLTHMDVDFQLSDGSYTKDQDEMGGPGFTRIYPERGYIEEDYGEQSWFNTGIGVGVGIGIGMFVGIGLGVGLLVNTYQLATKVFRRKWL